MQILTDAGKGVKWRPHRANPLQIWLLDPHMVESSFMAESKPIGIFSSLSAGFDGVASRPALIIPPLVLDLFLWLGPHLGIARLIDTLTEPAIQAGGLVGEQASLIRQVIESAGEQFNLLSALSTIPIGIPSLMAGRMPLENPLGLISRIDVDDAGRVLLIWIGLSGIGLVIGAYYQYWIAGAIAPDAELGPGWMAALRMAGFGFLIFVGGLVAGITVLIAITLATLILPLLGTGVFFLGFALLFWVAVYLIFTPHGIIRYNQGVFRSMFESFILVRWNLLPTVGYLAMAFGAYWILNLVWNLPSPASWFSLLAVAGHAFVATMLLAGSYAYYQGRREWLMAARRAV